MIINLIGLNFTGSNKLRKGFLLVKEQEVTQGMIYRQCLFSNREVLSMSPYIIVLLTTWPEAPLS